MDYNKKQLDYFKQMSLLVFLKYSNFKNKLLNKGIDEIIRGKNNEIKKYLNEGDKKLLGSIMLDNEDDIILNHLKGVCKKEKVKAEITKSFTGSDAIYFGITENTEDKKSSRLLALVTIYPTNSFMSLLVSKPPCRVKIEKRIWNKGIFEVIE
jgi:hypothetical protein